LNPRSPASDAGGLHDVLRPAVQAWPSRPVIAATQVKPELGGDDHLFAKGSEGVAHELFVDVRSLYFGGVEEGDAAFDGRSEQSGHLLLVFRRAIGEAHTHAAEAEGGDFRAAFPEFTFLQCWTPSSCRPRACRLRR
jgi:hypothetical protein